MRTVILIFTLLAAFALSAAAQRDRGASATSVPVTPEPGRPQWRIGYDLGNVFVLEVPELNPANDVRRAVDEAQQLLGDSPLHFGLGFMPFSRIGVQSGALVNPPQWTVVDLKGAVTRRGFRSIGVWVGTYLTSEEGGYHLISADALPSDSFLGVRREPSANDLMFAFAGKLSSKPAIRTRLSETAWENLLPVEDAEKLPRGYESAKDVLRSEGTQQRFLYGTSIEAVIRKQARRLWLLNYSNPDTTVGAHPWGIFAEEADGLRPLYVFKPSGAEAGGRRDYLAYLIAAIDLDQDGSDDLVIEADYQNGIAYKVISTSNGAYKETFTSYYRGS